MCFSYAAYSLIYLVRNQTTKTYMTKGYATKIGFPRLIFSYPSDWNVNEDTSMNGDKRQYDNIAITRDNYIVTINQELTAGASICQFDDMLESIGPSVDLSDVTYFEINSSLGNTRYFLNPLNEDKTINIYSFCIHEDGLYMFPRSGQITIETPVNKNAAIFEQALNIVRSIKPASD